MTIPLTPVAIGAQCIADAAKLAFPDLVVLTNVVSPISPPAIVIGPPRLFWRTYNAGGAPTTGQWNVYLIVAFNQYAQDSLLSMVSLLGNSIEVGTPGVILSAAPGIYPSPVGGLPCYVVTVQMELQ
jgi:hypothetical protein